jgi:hypothetical protein
MDCDRIVPIAYVLRIMPTCTANTNGQHTGRHESKVILLRKPFLKRTRHILSTMNGQQDGNPVVSRFIDDNKTVDRKTAYAFTKIGASRAHHRLIGVLACLCVNTSQFFESNFKAAARLMDVDTDVQQTLLCHLRLTNLGHSAQPFC